MLCGEPSSLGLCYALFFFYLHSSRQLSCFLIALAMSSLLYFLSALDTSRGLGIFSLLLPTLKTFPLIERSCLQFFLCPLKYIVMLMKVHSFPGTCCLLDFLHNILGLSVPLTFSSLKDHGPFRPTESLEMEMYLPALDKSGSPLSQFACK